MDLDSETLLDKSTRSRAVLSVQGGGRMDLDSEALFAKSTKSNKSTPGPGLSGLIQKCLRI